ncbi:hypothetical protein ACH9L7_20355 (plasmid) [Haloferax sp. S1W]
MSSASALVELGLSILPLVFIALIAFMILYFVIVDPLAMGRIAR